MSSSIHPTAVVDRKAELGNDVKIGPYCVIGADVVIGDRCELSSHVVVTGHTRIGQGNRFFSFSTIGEEPQDLKYHGEPSRVEIGDNNKIRENVTINAGTEGGGMVTRLGDGNLLMAYTHVAHDCLLGNHIVLANCSTLAGHVEVDDYAIIGGLSAVQQFVRVGELAMVGGMSGITKDVPPFCMVAGGYRSGLSGLNIVGLKRRGFTHSQIQSLKSIYRILLQGAGKREQRLADAEALLQHDDLLGHRLLTFVRTVKHGLTTHGRSTAEKGS